jgi:hypothetical protein
LIDPVRPIIESAFRTIIDGSVENYKAEAAQASKEIIRELDHVLKSKLAVTLSLYIVTDKTR